MTGLPKSWVCHWLIQRSRMPKFPPFSRLLILRFVCLICAFNSVLLSLHLSTFVSVAYLSIYLSHCLCLLYLSIFLCIDLSIFVTLISKVLTPLKSRKKGVLGLEYIFIVYLSIYLCMYLSRRYPVSPLYKRMKVTSALRRTGTRPVVLMAWPPLSPWPLHLLRSWKPG